MLRGCRSTTNRKVPSFRTFNKSTSKHVVGLAVVAVVVVVAVVPVTVTNCNYYTTIQENNDNDDADDNGINNHNGDDGKAYDVSTCALVEGSSVVEKNTPLWYCKSVMDNKYSSRVSSNF